MGSQNDEINILTPLTALTVDTHSVAFAKCGGPLAMALLLRTL